MPNPPDIVQRTNLVYLFYTFLKRVLASTIPKLLRQLLLRLVCSVVQEVCITDPAATLRRFMPQCSSTFADERLIMSWGNHGQQGNCLSKLDPD